LNIKGKKVKRIEIVAPVHNRREITLQCLRSLARIEKKDFEIHIIIVDDGSTDNTGEAIRQEFPDVQIIEGDGNLWFTEGTNVGVRAALERKPDFILMMNDDQVFDSKFLLYMVETAEKYPRSVVGPLLLLWNEPHKVFQVSPRWETFSGGWRHWYQQTVWTIPEKTWMVDMIVGNCVLFPVEAVREAGLLDSKRYPNFGDAEYTPRLKKKNWILLIDPRARVFCQPNTDTVKITQMNFREKLNAFFFNLGHIHNLRRRYYTNIDGAPNKLKGILALFVFFVRVLLKRSSETSWALNQPEKEVKEMFSANVMRD